MADLRTKIFDAIRADPKPMTEDRALQIGLAIIGTEPIKPREWRDWMQANGAQLVKLVNEL